MGLINKFFDMLGLSVEVKKKTSVESKKSAEKNSEPKNEERKEAKAPKKPKAAPKPKEKKAVETSSEPAEKKIDLAKYEAIDLGLSVKWANMDIGAEDVFECGDEFAWGEVKAKKEYSWKTYKHAKGGGDITKYFPFIDNKTTLDPEDDVAHVKMGGDWRMPTVEEFEELSRKCTIELFNVEDREGYVVKGPNGNSVFFPANTFAKNSFRSHYWTSEIMSNNNPEKAKVYVFFYNDDECESAVIDFEEERFNGFAVRAVCPISQSTSQNAANGASSMNESAPKRVENECSSPDDFEIEDGVLKQYKGQSGNVVIPDSVNEIGKSAFEGCKHLKSISIPDTVTGINDRAFAECSGLTSITIPRSVNMIGSEAFVNCSGLAEIDMTFQLHWMPNAFRGCNNVKTVYLDEEAPMLIKNVIFKGANFVKKE